MLAHPERERDDLPHDVLGGGQDSYLIGCGGIRAGVSPKADQLLLHLEVGALAEEEEGSRGDQHAQDEEHGEDAEDQELA